MANLNTHFVDAPVPYFTIDLYGTITDANKQGSALLGQTRDDLLGTSILPPHLREAQAPNNLLSLLTDVEPLDGKDLSLVHADGSRIGVCVYTTPLFDTDAKHIGSRVVMFNMTSRQVEAMQLLREERQRAQAELAAGVSHNLNNMLTGVIAPAQLLSESLRDPDALQDVQDILTSAMRARDLIRQLYQSVSGERSTARAVPVNAVIIDAIATARARWRDIPALQQKAIRIQNQLGDVPPISGSYHGLQEVILNLLHNAAESLSERGNINVRSWQLPSGHVCLSVSDNGRGISPENISKIYDPFFTTKSDVGSGLGLATVHATTRTWGWDLRAESSLNQGTIFILQFLPWSGGNTIDSPADTRTYSSLNILLIEDDVSVSRLLKRMLASKYEVTEAHSGSEALNLFSPGTFDAAVIDLGMPDVPGDQLAARFRLQDPNLATVLITGWPLQEGDPILAQFDRHVQKPLRGPKILRQAIREAIQHRNALVKKADG